MTKRTKSQTTIKAPILEHLTPTLYPLSHYSDEPNNRVANLLFSELSIETIQAEEIEFNGCHLKNQVIMNSLFENCEFNNLLFENCDFSNTTFHKCAFFRVKFINCKLTGTKFLENTFNHTFIESCMAPYSNFSMSKMNLFAISTCSFIESFFNDCLFNKVQLINSNFTKCDFSKTALKKIDLRSCKIYGINLNIADLKGAIISTIQAIDLIPLIGVEIKGE